MCFTSEVLVRRAYQLHNTASSVGTRNNTSMYCSLANVTVCTIYCIFFGSSRCRTADDKRLIIQRLIANNVRVE